MKKKAKKKRRRAVPLLLLALLAAGAAAYGYLQREALTEQDVGAYKTETVRRGKVATGISESGTVEFGTSEQIFSVAEVTEVSASDSGSSSEEAGSAGNSGMSQSGQGAGMAMAMTVNAGNASASSGSTASGEETSLAVEEVYLSIGQVVQKGDKLLKITEDSIGEYRAQLEAAVESAKRKVSQEEINVESKKAEADYTYQMYLAKGETAEATYEATIATLENAVAELEEELEDAEDDDEVEELGAELQIAKNNLATGKLEAKQTYENAMTNYKYADQLYAIDTDGLEDDLEDAKETLQEAEENLEEFEEQIGDGIIYAEYSGTVAEVAYGAGDTLANDAAVATFTDPEEVTITVSVSQEDISSVAVGDGATISLTAYSGEEFPGEVESISTSASAGSSTVSYDVAVRFTGDTRKVYSGMTGEAVFAGTSVGDTLYISNRAVFLQGARSYVKVLEEDGSIRTAEIRTGFSNGSIVAVESGLEEGETVIIESKVAQ